MIIYPLLCVYAIIIHVYSTIIIQWRCSRLASILTKVELPDDCS